MILLLHRSRCPRELGNSDHRSSDEGPNVMGFSNPRAEFQRIMTRGREPFKAMQSSAFWTAVSSCILAVTTVFLARITYETNRNSIASQQARLSFTGVIGLDLGNPPSTLAAAPTATVSPDGGQGAPSGRAVGNPANGITFPYTIGWRNSGTTPANNAFSRINYRPARDAMTRDSKFDFSDFKGAESTPFVLGPGMSTVMLPVGVSLQDIEDEEAGRLHL